MQYHLGVFRMLLLGFFMAEIKASDFLSANTKPRSPSRLREKNHAMMKTFETSLLGVFGLKTRPRPKRQVKVPEFMVNLYRSQSQDQRPWTDNRRALTIHRLSGNTISAFNSNTARSFTATVPDASWKEEYLTSEGDPNDLHLWFNVTSVPSDELSRAAELRVFRLRGRRTGCEEFDTHRNRPRPANNRLHLQIYDVIRPGRRITVVQSNRDTRNNSKTNSEEPLLRLLDTRLLDWRQSGWESFDVFPALQRWRLNQMRNYGLVLRFVSEEGQPLKTRHQAKDSKQRKCAPVRIASANASPDRQAILVTYTDDGRGGVPVRTSRVKRNTKMPQRKGKKNKNCRRHALYVDFNDVSWNDWIVAPPGYQAYYCKGECPFPLADHLNSTNHAIVQTLVNSVNQQGVPRACCVPTELSPISLLYVDEYDKVVLKNYQDMVVEGCGCR